jgi:hypothetical protein
MAHPGRELPDKAFGAFNPVITRDVRPPAKGRRTNNVIRCLSLHMSLSLWAQERNDEGRYRTGK